MVLRGSFTQETLQIDHHAVEIGAATSIVITLLEGTFEHFFCIVRDPSGVQRALITFKTRIKEYRISTLPLSTDNGALPGEIAQGTWTIDVVRPYPVAGGYAIEVVETSDVDYRGWGDYAFNPLATACDELFDARDGWYRGDFHAHSAWSDGRVSLAEVVQAAEQAKLDFFCMSDHSIVATKFPKTSCLVIPSTEVTWDDNGHYNVHGVTELTDWGAFISEANGTDMAAKSRALNAVFASYHSKGSVISINHPFPYGWELLHDFDMRNIGLLEVINAPHLLDEEIDNERAVRFFDYLWSQGHYLMGVGGSDAHKKNYFDRYPIGIPTTHVRINGLSIEHVLEAARLGHSFISVYEDFEVSFRRPGETKETLLPGDRTTGPVVFKARCSVPVVWELVRCGTVVATEKGRTCALEAQVEPETWWRLQARDAFSGELRLFVNPVHDCKAAPAVTGFQDVLRGFYASENASAKA